MKKQLKSLIYNRALEQGSWVTLIPYPSLMFSYQTETVRKGDEKNTKLIAAISSHMNGFRCMKICKSPLPSGHHHHNYCKKNCDKIDDFIRRALIRSTIMALKRKLAIGQQSLDIH